MAMSRPVDACVEAFKIIGHAAVKNRAPLRGIERKLRTCILDILAFKMAYARGLLSGELGREAEILLEVDDLRWSEMGNLLLAFAERRAVPDAAKETGLEGLWPLNEFVDDEILASSLAGIRALDGDQPVRVLGDVYQALCETPLPMFENDKERKRLRNNRRSRGLFFTPQTIVDKICGYVTKNAGKKNKAPFVCDPAMGTGHFLVSMAWKLAGGDQGAARHIASTRLFGVDSDPEAARLTCLSMWLEFSTSLIPFDATGHYLNGDSLVGALWEDTEEELRARKKYEYKGFDWALAFPEIKKHGGFDIVLGNPPYDVLTGFSKKPELKNYVAYLRECGNYDLSLGGQLNLYRLFIERSLRLLKKGGKFSFIIPSGFMTDKVASPLRCNMLKKHSMDKVEHFTESEKQFKGVGQSVIIFDSQKDKGKAETIRIKSLAGSADNKRHEQRLSVKLAEGLDKESVPIPMASPEDWKVIKWINEKCTERFDAIATGAVGEVDQTVYRPFMKDDKGSLLVRGCHVGAYAIDTTDEPSKERYLDVTGFLQKKGSVADSCELTASRPRVVQLGIRNMESTPRLVAARAEGGIYLGNSVNYWLPKERVPLSLILALLNSSFFDWRFRITSSNNNINVYEVESLPIPDRLVAYFRLDDRIERRERHKTASLLDDIDAKVSAVERLAKLDQNITRGMKSIDDSLALLFGFPDFLKEHIFQ